MISLFSRKKHGREDGDATRRHILETAVRLFAEHGYADTTSKMICREAGVNIAACAFLSAVSRPRQALLISLLRSCMLLIPAAILLSLALNTTGVWLAFLITEAACCVISLVFLKAAAK